MIRLAIFLALGTAPAAFADGGFFTGRDVVFLGEQHDNPAHHRKQAELVGEIAPQALVFEMLTPEQAARVTPDLIADEDALEEALGWAESGWPDFAMYYPVFAAAPEAAYFGAALPRAEARRVMEAGTEAVFGPEAARFGLDQALPEDQQAAREALQLSAHCDAMPAEMLPMMVDIQRLRDARLAQEALAALESAGAPVVVITGNGHARPDWGAPFVLSQAAPDVTYATFGQGEATFGAPDGGFDMVDITEDVERGDPCAAFNAPAGD